MRTGLFCILSMIMPSLPAHATDNVLGQISTFESYNGVTERCVRISPMPNVRYDPDDLEEEAKLCRLDLYDANVALCPKIWSTSAAIVFYDISEGKFQGDRRGFQTTICAGGKIAKYVAKDEISRLKFTMNQATTSATFTPSSLLYYHLSRYFNFSIAVPVAVWRSVDKSVLLNEVALGGRDLSAGQDELAANHAAWSTIVEAIQQPDAYKKPGSYGSAMDFLTADGTAAFGTIYDGGGTQYGPEINGSVVFDTAENRYAAFLQGPAVRALNSDLPLAEAIDETLKSDDAMFTPEGRETQRITAAQMAFWMHDLAEILMIDSIMGQQDRPGNIDYREYYYWQEDGKTRRKRVRDQVPGEGDIPAGAVILLSTRLNDNDAGGRPEYDNHLVTMMALQNIHHFDPALFEKLQSLDEDFRNQGPTYQWLRSSFGLEEDQVEMITKNTAHIALTLRNRQLQGSLRLDLKSESLLNGGGVLR